MRNTRILTGILLVAASTMIAAPAAAGTFKTKTVKSGFSQQFKSQNGHKYRSGKRIVRPRNTIRSLKGGRGIGFNGGFDFRGGV